MGRDAFRYGDYDISVTGSENIIAAASSEDASYAGYYVNYYSTLADMEAYLTVRGSYNVIAGGSATQAGAYAEIYDISVSGSTDTIAGGSYDYDGSYSFVHDVSLKGDSNYIAAGAVSGIYIGGDENEIATYATEDEDSGVSVPTSTS